MISVASRAVGGIAIIDKSLIISVTHPDLYDNIMKNGFTVSLTGQPFTRIPCDQVIELTVNKSSKSTGGLSGKTENVGASERWMRIDHILAALRDTLDNVTRNQSSSHHVDLGEKRMETDEKDVQALVDTLKEWVPSAWDNDQDIVNISRGMQSFMEFLLSHLTLIYKDTMV